MQHNIYELNRRLQGDIVDLHVCYRVKLVGAGSKSNTPQLLLVPAWLLPQHQETPCSSLQIVYLS